MIELRWIKMDNWQFGKFKLQYKHNDPTTSPGVTKWLDVPVVEEEAEKTLSQKLYESWVGRNGIFSWKELGDGAKNQWHQLADTASNHFCDKKTKKNSGSA